MDGRAVLACKERMKPIVDAGHVPVISAMGNLPVLKDLVVDMDPFWAKMRGMKPWLEPGYADPEKENLVSEEQMEVIHKEALCINCGCCVSECNSMESDPGVPRARGARQGHALRRRRARRARRSSGSSAYNSEHGIWDCTRCYFCNERCPKGVDPRDAIAKLGAESIKHGIDRDMGAKHAKWFVTSAKTTGWLRETELVPKTQGVVAAIKQIKFAMSLAKHGKVPPPFPPHVAEGRRARRARSTTSSSEQGRDGAAGIVQGEKALARIEFIEEGGRARARTRGQPGEPQPKKAEEGRVLQGLPRVAVGEGARHLDAGARAEARARARRARVGHVLRRRRHPRGRARLLPPPERAHPRLRGADRRDTLMTICNVCTLNLRQANWQLKIDDELRERVNANLEAVGVPPYTGGVEVSTSSG